MTISTLDQYALAAKQYPLVRKTTAHGGLAVPNWTSYWDATGVPGAGTLAAGNTANGVVPTATTTGAIPLNAISGNLYLTGMEYTGTQLCRALLADRLFHAGAYAFNASTTLASQPSYSSRIPSGTDYTGLQLWLEGVTLFTGAPTVTVTYTNQSGVAGQSTAVTGASGYQAGRMLQIPLANGDSGIQKIESVVGTIASAGTFNLLILRPIWIGRIEENNLGGATIYKVYTDPIERIFTQLFADSCLMLMQVGDSTSNPVLELYPEFASA